MLFFVTNFAIYHVEDLVIKVTSEQVLRVLLKSGGKAEQQVAPEAREDFPSHPLVSLNTVEERLLLWLEYHPQVARYARGDLSPQFATTYRLPAPKHTPFTIGYAFEGKPHDYLPDVVGTLSNGKLFIAEAGMEDDKRGDRNLAKAEAARRLVCLQRGIFWMGSHWRVEYGSK